MPQEIKGFYEFDSFRLDPLRRVLLRQGEPVPLPPKAMLTLLVLVEKQGEIVDKEELLQKVWPDTFISEATLTQNVFRLRKALGEEAGENRFIVTVPGRGYSFVAEARWLEAEEEPAAVEPVHPEVRFSRPQMPVAAPPEPEPVRPTRRRLLVAGAALAVLLLLLIPALFVLKRPVSQPAVSAPTGSALRRSAAVWSFRNLSGRPESDWLGTALAEMFTVELAVGETLHIVPAETVARARLDLGLEEAEDLSGESLARIRGILGCDAVILGSYLELAQKAGNTIRVDLRLVDAASGETLAATTRTRPEPELFDMVSELGADLRSILGAGGLPGRRDGLARASFPANREAARLYSEGLSRLRTLDHREARDLLLQAVQAEPGFPLAHAALARAWLGLGYDAKAEAEAAQAFELSTGLQREERLLVEALRAETAKDWDRAVDIYRTLWTFFPDDIEHGLRLARAQIGAGKARQALGTLADLRRLPALLAADPRLDLAEAEAAAALANYPQQEKLAARAAAQGEEIGARLLVAQARRLQARALRSLGRNQEVQALVEEAARLFRAAGDQAGLAATLNDSANLEMDQGNLEGARQSHLRALAIHRETGNQYGRMVALASLGGLESEKGNFPQARELLLEALAVSREIKHRRGEADSLTNLGNVLQYQGELQAAQQRFQECLSLYQSVGSPLGEATARANLASVLLDLGELKAARREAQEALPIFQASGHKRGATYALGRTGALLMDEGRLPEAADTYRNMLRLGQETGQKSFLAEAHSGLASVARLQGDLQSARKREGEALKLRSENREKLSVLMSRLSLARISLDEGDAVAAEREARTTSGELRALGVRDWEGLAHEVLALALLAEGKVDSAEQAVQQALLLTERSQNRRIRLRVLLAAGRIAAENGRSADGRRLLEEVHREAASRGLVVQRLEAELALGELELRHGDAAAVQRRLQALEKEASGRGFRLIAGKAAALLRRPSVVLGQARVPRHPWKRF